MEILLFIIGSSIGSFLNVLIDRLPRNETVLHGRSHCDSCHHTLQWYDLIPLFSFITLRGKCRYCHRPIGYQALVMELLTGIMFACTWIYLARIAQPTWLLVLTLVYLLYIFSSFLVIMFIDLQRGIIPNAIVYPAFCMALIYHLILFPTLLPYLLSALGAGFFFFLLFFITKGRGMGFGDVKLAFVLGLFLGFPDIIIALYIAFLTGACIAFILVIARKKKFAGGTIPFGPFLILGSFIAFFFGDMLWQHILLRIL